MRKWQVSGSLSRDTGIAWWQFTRAFYSKLLVWTLDTGTIMISSQETNV